MAAILDWASLCLAPGIGLAGFWRLVESLGSPERVLAASAHELRNIPGIQARQLSALSSPELLRQRAKDELELLAAQGCLAIAYSDERYPPLLRQITDPPPILYLAGCPDLLQTDMIAVVGSRAASTYGRRIAYSLARTLSHSLTIVSGLALGIDTEAHTGTLSENGRTIAVLGCGLDVVYPYQNRRLYERIRETGLLVSEYPLGTTPEGFRFPARNRIIAGLSLGVLVVEAARKSGSLITAQLALDSGREVFAVPGQVDSIKSEGTHWLLKQGAKLVQSADDVLEEFQIMGISSCHSGEVGRENEGTLLADPEAVALLSMIEAYPQTRDNLTRSSGFPPARLSELLLLLELEGYVEVLPGDAVRSISGHNN